MILVYDIIKNIFHFFFENKEYEINCGEYFFKSNYYLHYSYLRILKLSSFSFKTIDFPEILEHSKQNNLKKAKETTQTKRTNIHYSNSNFILKSTWRNEFT